ncbi:WbuC family cupin fold metalloprotein [Pseudomonas sp. B21-054]|uniref:WbuC family cupin fold metalloprotein n=1 Tax=Pseudomonas sp. B21-054 TaxID=2895494 RepID=UPI00222E2570|nr:WbuC family cupin fold metalloprotein [Pseudomonas sp. B21-054]UZE17043.1 WbuC family cupin fold metalloprotein [Pseudomonas sp. B21-054]
MTRPGFLDQALFDELADKAAANPRGRQHHNFHQMDEPCHRMAVGLQPSTYIPPHRHLSADKAETLLVLRGRLGVLLFAFQLVDVRDVDEHQQGSLGGSLIPLKDIIKRQEELDTTRRIVFYCKSGLRSKAALLAVRSFSQEAELYSLEGGIERYLAIYPDERRPVVS